MTGIKQLGVCIDDTGITVMEYKTGMIKKIALPALPDGTNEAGSIFKKSEGFSYDIEIEQHTNYIEQLKSVISHSDSLLLFGPTNLKVDLYNFLKRDDSFANTTIILKQADVMSENQQQAFVMDYFESIVAA